MNGPVCAGSVALSRLDVSAYDVPLLPTPWAVSGAGALALGSGQRVIARTVRKPEQSPSTVATREQASRTN